MMGSGAQHEAAIAIGAFDILLVPHFQIDFRVPESAADSVAGDAGIVHFYGFGCINGHGQIFREIRADHSHGRPLRNCQEMLLEQAGFRA